MGVFEAWKEGEQIQYKSQDGNWKDCSQNLPCWSFSGEYRVKPKPEYLLHRHYIACLRDSNGSSYSAGVFRYEGKNQFSRHSSLYNVDEAALKWINPKPIELVRE